MIKKRKEIIILFIGSILVLTSSLMCFSGCSKSDPELNPSLGEIENIEALAGSDITTNSFIANWNATKLDAIQLYVSTKEDFSEPLSGYNPLLILDNTKTAQLVSGLTEGNTYYYRVSGKQNNKQGHVSNIIKIVTGKTDVLVPIPVAAIATNIGANSFSANWEALTAIDSCYLDVSDKQDFTTKIAGYNPKVIKNPSLTTQTVTGLDAGKTYYYRLQAWQKGKQGAVSNIQTVTTIAGKVTLVDDKGLFGQYIVSLDEFNLWNTLDMDSDEVTGLMEKASKEVYKTWQDKFDFIVFVLNNTSNPAGMPFAQAIPLRNTVKGLGYSDKLNEATEYGSPSQLQAVSILYKIQYSATSANSSLITGPILHELAHRWMNFGLEEGAPHWPSYTIDGNYEANSGIFASPTNNYAPIELYLMGLIDGSEITDATNKAMYDKIVAAQGLRIPSKANSQKDFKAIIVVVTPQELTPQQITTTNKGVTGLTDKVLTGTGVNFFRQTGGKGSLSCTLNDVKK